MSSLPNTENITSPCIGVCAMSETTGLCLGCYRTIEEIKQWWDLSPEAKQEIIKILEQRQIDTDSNIDFGD